MPPSVSAASPIADAHDFASTTSHSIANAPGPASPTASSRRARRRASSATCAPRRARPTPMQRPSPLEAPTTTVRIMPPRVPAAAAASCSTREPRELPEVVEPAGVELTDLARFLVGNVMHGVGEDLATVGPVRVVVREIGLPRQLVEADEVPVEDRVTVGDHADPEVLREHLGRQPGAVDAL